MFHALAVIAAIALHLHLADEPTPPHPTSIGRHIADTRRDTALPCVRCAVRHLVMTTPPAADNTGFPPGGADP
ncbi:hypothetical protein QQG74_21425 [Micromonospora sp. FIMYZ51]|uniref:hypothetical protein n=1 Tax=Micromonospora sp. FIMYZ51 TaxID=3051832 RepID=UPI00311F3AB1